MFTAIKNKIENNRFLTTVAKRKKFKSLVGAAVIIALLISAFAVIKITSKHKEVVLPQNFLDARFNAASVSRRIVELTDEVSRKIEKINFYDLDGKSYLALELVNEAKTSNEAAYREAVQLSNNLEQMAISLADLPPGRSQRKAYEAIAIELSLVSEFIRYTQNLNDFLSKLGQAISLNSEKARKEIYGAVDKVNKSAQSINKLNTQFIAKMKEFDDSL